VLGGSLSADALQEHAGRFVVGVLGHQLALEGALQDGLAQPLGALQVGLDLHFKLVNHGEAALDFGDDAVLLGEWGQRNTQRLDVSVVYLRDI
jgi:hypothetical protein